MPFSLPVKLSTALNNVLGGAIANMYAMNAARHRIYPRAKPLGMTSVLTLCAFTSEDVLIKKLISLFYRVIIRSKVLQLFLE